MNNALTKTIEMLRTLTDDQLSHAEGIAAARFTKAEWNVFAAAAKFVREERKLNAGK